MFKTEDNYNLYFDGVVSQDHIAVLEELVRKHELQPEFINLVKRDHNFRIHHSYNRHRSLLWVLYKTLGPYAITIFFAELEHPRGCEYQSRVDFYVEVNGRFEYELKNSLFLYADYDGSEECQGRIEERSMGFDEDRIVRGNIQEMDLETFEKSVGSND